MNKNQNCDVLVVDDDAAVLMLVNRRLRDSGLTFKTLSSGNAALDYLSNSKVRLLLVDLHMEPMNGLELVEALESKGRRDSTRICLSTSAQPDAEVCRLLQELNVEVLMKKLILTPGGINSLMDDTP